MTNRIRGAHAAALAIVAVAAPGAQAAPVTVNVRVEGATQTIFEGPVTTDVHQTTTPTDGQPRTCDGSSVGNPVGPTATGALDDAARAAGFVWDAGWDSGFSDYYPFLRIGPDQIDSSHYLALYVNWQYAQAGGCGQRITNGDEVVWAYDDFDTPVLLRLSGPGSARTGESFRVKVIDALDGSVEQGATVGGATTGADGEATLSFAEPGIYRLKADRPNTTRSNTLPVCIDPPGADPCTSTDKAGPALSVDQPRSGLVSERFRSRTFVVSWQGDDGLGAGVANYSLEFRELGSGLRTSKIVPGEWKLLRDRIPGTSAHFRGEPGKAYQFRISAVDRATNRASIETEPLLLPLDVRRRRWLTLSPGWDLSRSDSAWGRTLMTAENKGAEATLRFSGRSVSLIGRKLPRGGRVRLSVDGRSRVVSLRGRTPHRSLLWTSSDLADRNHVLRIRSLGGGPVELDALAPRP
jgi:hypothetical protein